MISVVIGRVWRDGCPKERAESLLLSWCKGAVGTLWFGVGNPSVVAVARENSDAVKVGCGNFVMWLFDRAESFASSFTWSGVKGAQ